MFLKQAAVVTAGLSLAPDLTAVPAAARAPQFKISLAEWSLHKAIFEEQLDHLDFPKAARQAYGIDAIELINQFFKDKAKDKTYLAEFKKRADGEGVKILLIMCDDEGHLGADL
jgi:L-ribulose-5-phosphate 3-epimerase